MRRCLLLYFQNVTVRHWVRDTLRAGRALREPATSLKGPQVAPRHSAQRGHTGGATMLASSYMLEGKTSRAALCELCFSCVVMQHAGRRTRARWPHLHAAGSLQWLQLWDTEQAISSHYNWPRVNSARQPRLAFARIRKGSSLKWNAPTDRACLLFAKI